MQNSRPEPLTWWQCEPRRLQRDQDEVRVHFPDLEWQDVGAGGWMGRLPLWPFARPAPSGLGAVLSAQGLLVAVVYGHAYPMVPPAVVPGDPEPLPSARTDQRWHVMGDGSLCLFQDDATWTGRDSIVDLLLKAAGWRIEFELMRRELISAMTINGIIDDDQLDHLLAEGASKAADETPGAAVRAGGNA